MKKLLFWLNLVRIQMRLIPIGARAQVRGARPCFCYIGTGYVGLIGQHVLVIGPNKVELYYRFEGIDELVSATAVERMEQWPSDQITHLGRMI